VFPQYTAAETAADSAIHLLALSVAISAVGWQFLLAYPSADTQQQLPSRFMVAGWSV
jgi:hypothetical protein